jgi:predicted membrane channel-forming protein YqfA (hemolysin III family)
VLLGTRTSSFQHVILNHTPHSFLSIPAISFHTMIPPGKRRSRRSTAAKAAAQTRQALKGALLCFHDIEAWQRDNEYVCGRYRNISGSYRESLKSLFYLHNQTGNIYSHLIGAVVFFTSAFYVYDLITTRYSTADVYDILAFAIFIGSAIICFGFSATFHAFGNHSSRVYHTWLILDLYGIFVLIAGTVYSGTYYGFYCEPSYWIMYSVGVSMLLVFQTITNSCADCCHRSLCCHVVLCAAISHTQMAMGESYLILCNRMVRRISNDACRADIWDRTGA